MPKLLADGIGVIGKVADRAASSGVSRLVSGNGRREIRTTLTIARPGGDIEEFWSDPQQLSRILGDLGEVTATPPAHRYRWTLHLPGGRDIVWQSELTRTRDGVRFVDVNDGLAKRNAEVAVTLREAPGGLGTEATVTLAGFPGPKILWRTAVFKALYRCRALLQTGELPSLTPTPAARPGNR